MTLKSIKMYTWTSKRLVGDRLDPWITKMVSQGTQTGASRSPKYQFSVQKVTHLRAGVHSFLFNDWVGFWTENCAPKVLQNAAHETQFNFQLYYRSM